MVVICYVDAENLSNREVELIAQCVCDNQCNSDKIELRIYGCCTRLNSVRSLNCCKSATFVETYTSSGKKKTADVTIITDAITEAVLNHSVKAMWLCTKDCDFKPLVSKLSRFGVTVKTPFMEQEGHTTIADVRIALKARGWDPLTRGIEAFYDQREHIRSLLSDEFSDELISKFLKRKKCNFLKEIQFSCASDLINTLRECEPFDFRDVVKVWKGDSGTLERFAICYTYKYYGLCFNEQQNHQYVQDLISSVLVGVRM